MKKLTFLASVILCLTAFAPLCAQDDFNVAVTVAANGLRGEVSSVDVDHLIKKEYYREDWEQRPWFIDRLREFMQESDGYITKFNKKGVITQTTVTVEGTKIGSVNYSYKKDRIVGYEGFGTKVEAEYKGQAANVNIYGYGGVVNFKPRVTKNGIDTWDWKDRSKVRSIKGAYQFVYTCRQKYDASGHLLESRYLYNDSTVAKVIRYKYSHRHLMTEQQYIQYRDNKPYDTTVVTYAYDLKDNLCKATLRSNAVDEVYSFKNNEIGDPETVNYDCPYESCVYTFRYVYDSLSNWTTRLDYKNGVFQGATLRNITYYSTEPSDGELYVYFDDEDAGHSKVKKKEKEDTEKVVKAKKSDKPSKDAKVKKSDKPSKEAKAKKSGKPSKEAKAKKSDKPAKEAKAKKADKPAKDAKVKKSDKPAKEAKAKKADKPAKEAKAKKADKPAKDAKVKKSDKPAKDAKVKKADKPAKDAKVKNADKPAKEAKAKKSDKPAKDAKAKKADKPAKEAKAKKADKPAKDAKVKKADKPAKEAKAKKADKPAKEAKAKKSDKPAKDAKVKKEDKPAKDAKVKKADKPAKEAKVKKADKPAKEAKAKKSDKAKKGDKPANDAIVQESAKPAKDSKKADKPAKEPKAKKSDKKK
ncbi:MAG: hypothetical protein J6X62_04525 [Bacteroidales bacterium]|nr:hypothetical protein [Bacteroidales bacterium]